MVQLLAIPDLNSIQLPLLQLIEDKKKHTYREVLGKLGTHFQLTKEELDELTQGGSRPKFTTRVLWAISQLRNARLLENTQRGEFKITKRGLEVLKQNPKKIDNNLLKKFPEYKHFLGLDKDETSQSKSKVTALNESPLEVFEESYQKMKSDWIQDILTLVRKCSPDAFERLVVQLVVKMGYGGTIEDAGKAIGKQGDEGIDGVIKEDELGFEKIYVQAKRWDSSVGRPKLQEFVGALHGQKARKGIFITTSNFTRDALEYKDKIDDKTIILIDGNKLAEYMIRYNLGVSTTNVFEMKQIDSDFFEEV